LKEEIPVATAVAMGAEEWFGLSRRMEYHHSVFYTLWQMGKPIFTNRIKTAAIGFIRGNPIEFIINPEYWAKSSPVKRDFILCHEMLHIILNHGMRGRDSIIKEAANVATDVVVNHMLIDHFGFKREEVDPESELCWRDTVFKGRRINENQTFEYYYNKLKTFSGLDKLILVDDHGGLFAADGSILSPADMEKIASDLSNAEKEQLKAAMEKDVKSSLDSEAGTEAGALWKTMSDEGVKQKRKWETVIKKWADPFMPRADRTAEHWLRTNRRLSLFPDAALLPSEMEEDDKPELGKINVLLLLDTSGSCAHLAERFWKAGRSLPKSRFEVTMACFDTEVYPVDMKEKNLYGFGGTSFRILETYAKNIDPYPTAVFVITDGFGDMINPSFPKRWYWFLTTDHRSYIPKDCHFFRLADYE
jgi:predicted metal-dependent peptidase